MGTRFDQRCSVRPGGVLQLVLQEGVIALIGNGGHYGHLIAEGCDPDAELVAIGNNSHRRREAIARDLKWDRFLSSDAVVYVSEHAIGEGSQIMAGAVIHAPLGRHCIVGNNAVVSHDCKIGDFVFVGPGAVICGGCEIGEGVFVGAGAVVTPNAKVPSWKFIKANERYSYADSRTGGRRLLGLAHR